MKIRGIPVGAAKSRAMYVGDVKPEETDVLWFDTSGVAASGASLLDLEENGSESGAIVEVGGVNYAVTNVVEETSTEDPYDYTII